MENDPLALFMLKPLITAIRAINEPSTATRTVKMDRRSRDSGGGRIAHILPLQMD